MWFAKGTEMKRAYTIWATILLCCFVATAAERPSADQIAEGQKLSQQLRQALPPEGESEVHGTLIISHDGKRHVPVVCRTIVRGGVWQTIYESKGSDGIPAERLVITRSPGGRNQYAFSRAASVGAPAPEPKPISTEQAYVPFAQSDFWLSDLGMEFIFWPQQARLKGQLRLSRDCYVLQSENQSAPQIIRIKSFIDKESVSQGTAGILVAEGFDARNKLVKEFSLHGSSFKKVNGQLKLERMEIRNAKSRSQTVLKFDLPKE
jgi:hypothetical protein